MRPLLLLLSAAALLAQPSVDLSHGPLRVSENKRAFVHADGTPFFYLGDTAWELFHRLNREEAERYLEDRRARRFTVIQAVALAELDGLNTPNPYGNKPLHDNDPARPNDAYFQHVDWIVKRAAEKGLIIGLLPSWGRYVRQGSWEKESAAIFTESSAYAYGQWIAARYADAPNLIWILGGDRTPEGVVPIWRAMARGIRESDTGRHLITFHPQGRQSSSQLLHNEDWLDFNMFQSGHNQRDKRNDEMTDYDYSRLPVKPVVDGEPRYENHPIDWRPKENGFFDGFDVRQAAWWSVLAGAAGHTYGCHDIWQMLAPGREPVGFARGTWQASLALPGADQMRHLRALIEAHDPLTRAPAQHLLASGAQQAGSPIRVALGKGYLLAYTPFGEAIQLLSAPELGKTVRASWFDPRTGLSRPIGPRPNAPRRWLPPGKLGRGQDWVLVLEAAR